MTCGHKVVFLWGHVPIVNQIFAQIIQLFFLLSINMTVDQFKVDENGTNLSHFKTGTFMRFDFFQHSWCLKLYFGNLVRAFP